MTYRGRVANGVVLLEGQPSLPDGTEVRVVPVHDEPSQCASPIPGGSAGEFWQQWTVEGLAEQQNVVVPVDLDELAGDWPEDQSLDDFLELVKQTRQ